MRVSIEIEGSERLKDTLGRVKKELLSPELLEGITRDMGAGLKQRTEEGLDYEGRRFEPYSEKYKKIRRKKGKKTGAVDLRMSGRMPGSMETRVDPTGTSSVLYFKGAKEKEVAFCHNEEGVGKKKVKREFFNLSDEDQKRLEKLIGSHIDKVLREA